jgi:hypothetical protein
MSDVNTKSKISPGWEELYKKTLFEADVDKLPRLIQLAKHAVLDRLEDLTFARKKEIVQADEMAALRNAHRALTVLEKLYVSEERKLVA